ncbi:hypothetical protein [Levilactobacillus wangkuiensis]|uniref:hypothetical protein n=1 Tax=Levilactobacillus wangkuiensis TaxID=2799566 RepID=UPI001942C7CE|nr:hypothetical protein [Levilactobacillus wangkuiensis]
MEDMKSADITIKYHAQEYNEVYTFFSAEDDLSIVKIQTMLALRGLEQKNRIPLVTDDGSGISRTLSRVSYNKWGPDYDDAFGLLTILDNLDKPYDQVLNHMAFANNKNGEKYATLPNVSTFYEYMLGGIESCYQDIAKYGIHDKRQILDSMNEYFQDNEDFIAQMR